MAAMDIPESAEAITPAWLSEAVPGARASAVEVVDAHSGTTGRARLRVTWEDGDLSPALFAKLAPTDPIQRAMAVETGMGARESRFYHAVGRELPVRVPRPLCSFWSDDGRSYIMLGEDLVEAGCHFPDFHAGGDADVIQGALESLARLHAAYWESPRFEDDLAWIEPPMHNAMGTKLISAGVEAFGAEQPPAFHAIAEIYLEHHDAFGALVADGPTTLAHGDPHLGNFFVEGKEVGFLDWACVSRAPGMRDVGYFLCGSAETELRRANQERWIRRYLEVLAEHGAPRALLRRRLARLPALRRHGLGRRRGHLRGRRAHAEPGRGRARRETRERRRRGTRHRDAPPRRTRPLAPAPPGGEPRGSEHPRDASLGDGERLADLGRERRAAEASRGAELEGRGDHLGTQGRRAVDE